MPADSSKRLKPPKPAWTIADLIDLEYILHQEGLEADPEFFEKEIEPWIAPDAIARPGRDTMSRALWRWLATRRKTLSDDQLPGRAFAAAQTALGIGTTLLMLLAGGSLVLGILEQGHERTYNILILLATTLGIPYALLLLTLTGLLTWRLWRSNSFVSLTQRWLFNLTSRLARKSLGEEAANWWRETARTRQLFTLPAFKLSQAASIAFSAGAILALAGSVLFLTVRFGWETTATEAMEPKLERLTTVLSSPWAWLKPEWSPTAEDIRDSRISWEGTRPVLPGAEQARSWYPFLLASLLVWGVLPRFLLWCLFAQRERRALARYSFQERAHREWWRDLTELEVRAETPGPSDGAFALLYGGMNEPAGLRRATLQQLRLNIEERATHGAGSLDDDRKALDQAAAWLVRHPEGRLVLVAEGWSLAPKEFRDFHASLRESLGDKVPVETLLIGLPGDHGTLTAPQADEIRAWERLAAELGDVALYIRPYQPSVAID